VAALFPPSGFGFGVGLVSAWYRRTEANIDCFRCALLKLATGLPPTDFDIGESSLDIEPWEAARTVGLRLPNIEGKTDPLRLEGDGKKDPLRLDAVDAALLCTADDEALEVS